jgi:hypothetical protein
LRNRFPQAQHPDKFDFWCIQGYSQAYKVKDYTLNIPTHTRPTAIHFMLYEGDERWGVVEKRSSELGFQKIEPTLDRWKQQQAEDKLDFLVVSEF